MATSQLSVRCCAVHMENSSVSMKQYGVLIFLTSLVISAKFERIHKLIFKEDLGNQSEFNEIDFHNKRHYYYKIDGGGSKNKSSEAPKNYLNYRDLYGIRYSPKRKVLRLPITHNSHTNDANKVNRNYSSAHNNVSLNNFNLNNNFLITTVPANIESEGMSPLSSAETIMESTTLQTLQTLNKQQDISESNSSDDDDNEEYEENSVHNSNGNKNHNNDHIEVTEQDTDETNSHHIMKPNNRVEHALDFLANRMKNLMFLSNDQNRVEPNISPHLLSLGKFLNLFSMIRVDSFPCATGRRPLRQLYGSCLNEAECINMGGISMDRCANGFGVCCICKFNFLSIFFYF